MTGRRREYGEPADLFRDIAKRWSLVLGVEVSPAQTVLCMLDVKMARLTRDPRHADSIADLVHRSRQKIHPSLAAHATLPRFRRCLSIESLNLLNASVH